MAKKKVTQQAHAAKQQNPSLGDQNHEKDEIFTQEKPLKRQPSMEDPAEKMQSLKSLNSMLLKETFERRHQVESLEQAKAALETQLTRSSTQMMDLASDLNRESDKNLGLELERYFLCAIIETQMKEIVIGFGNLVKERADQDSEIRSLTKEVDVLRNSLESESHKVSRAYQERDLVESNLSHQVEEVNRLKDTVFQMEKRERKFEEEIGKLTKQQKCLKDEKLGLEKSMQDARKEKELMTQELEAMLIKSESFEFGLERVVNEKEEIERQMGAKRAEIDELKKERKNLDELVLRFREDEALLRHKVLELEKSWAEAMERAAEVDTLMQEKTMTSEYVRSLMEEKEMVDRKFEMATSDLEESQRKVEGLLEETGAFERIISINEKEMLAKEQMIEELSRERDEAERIRMNLESANVELQTEVSKQKDEVSRLRESYRNQEHKNKELTLKADQLKSAIDQVALDRDDTLKGLEEEKRNGLSLMAKVSEMTKMIDLTSKELKETRNVVTKLMDEKTGMVGAVDSLEKDKDKLQNELLEANQATADLKAKMETASGNADQAFALLKKTASLLLCDSESRDGNDIVGEKLGNEIEAYAAGLEAIKKAFRNKEMMIDEMKREVKSMETSMAQVQKKKGFWTLISTLTAIFAAASFYVAKGR